MTIRTLKSAIAILGMAMATELVGDTAEIFQWTDPQSSLTWTFTMSDDGSVTFGGGQSGSTAIPANTAGVVVVPEKIGSHPVKALASYAFEGCCRIERIELPTGLETVGGYAFHNCSSLSEIVIPASVSSIGDRALIQCGGLTNIAVSADNPCYFAEDGMLYDRSCTTMITCAAGKTGAVAIRDGVLWLGTEAFSGCDKLTEIILPETLESISYGAFKDCSSIGALVLPESVQTIDLYAFEGCRSLAKINIPESVESIGGGAFVGCDSLDGYRQDGVLVIDGVAVDCDYDAEGEIMLPDGCRMITDWAFRNCPRVSGVIIPEAVSAIGCEAFAFCESLQSVRFLGDAPTASESYYGDASCLYRESASVTNYVFRQASGWTGDNWPADDEYARPVVILDADPDEHPLTAVCDHVVTSSSDTGAGSLSEAIGKAKDGDVILFDLPDGDNTICLESSLVLPENRFSEQGLTIGGDNGGRQIVIKGNGSVQLLKVQKGNKVNVDGIVFEGGRGNFGGAIENRGALTVRNCSFTRNESPSWGGAICNITAASLYAQNCVFTENNCGSWGGAIASHTTPITTILGCRFAGNSCAAWGGAVAAYSTGDTLVVNCDIHGNQSYGGAIVAQSGARLTIIGSTITDNEGGNKGNDIYNLGGTVNAIGSYSKDNYGTVSGTTDLPVVPTSLFSAGTRAVGDWYSQVKGADGARSLQLNATARPGFAAKEPGKPTFELTDEDYVTMKVDNVKPLLYYGLGWSSTPSGEFVVEPGLWVQADENGVLSSDVKAPKGNGGSRFFRIKVTDDPSIGQ